jgi:hypothetical protein
MRSLSIRLFVAAAIALSAAGCKQKVGERCQLNSDCEGFPGTNFCAVQGGQVSNGGICQPINGGIDLGVPVDLSSDDLGSDGGPDGGGTD